MSKFRGLLLTLAIAGCVYSGVSAEASELAGARTATPLTNTEIFNLYARNSWIWKEGAGHFSPRARRFTAWSKENGSLSYGLGRWFITGPGKLCFNAKWHAESGAAVAITCFSHRKQAGLIYQKREPNGKWYVFRNDPPEAGDEFAKLHYGDDVGPRLEKVQAMVDKGK